MSKYADIDITVASLFRLTSSLPIELKDIYSNFGIDVGRFNSNDSWQLPMSGRFIIDEEGIIKSVEVHPDYSKRPDPSEIIEIVQPL